MILTNGHQAWLDYMYPTEVWFCCCCCCCCCCCTCRPNVCLTCCEFCTSNCSA